jgi:hypothetical protein
MERRLAILATEPLIDDLSFNEFRILTGDAAF